MHSTETWYWYLIRSKAKEAATKLIKLQPHKEKLYAVLCFQACRENLLLHMFLGICVYMCGTEVRCYCMYALYDTDFWHNSVNFFVSCDVLVYCYFIVHLIKI